MSMNLQPDRLAELELLLARIVAESERLQLDAGRARDFFLGTSWVGPAADRAADGIRALLEHMAATRSDARDIRALVTQARQSMENTDAALAHGIGTAVGVAPRDELIVSGRSPSSDRENRTGASSAGVSQLNLSIYLSDNNESALRSIRDGLSELLLQAGFERPEWDEVRRGSLWQRGHAKNPGRFPKDEVARRLEKVERALQVNNLDLPQSQANHANAQAVAAITAAHAGIADVVLQLGSLVYVKWTDPTSTPRVLSRTLSVRELVQFEASPHLLSDAGAALEFLQSESESKTADALPGSAHQALPAPEGDQ